MEDNEEVEFTIKCKMKRSWMNTFCSFLKTMERFGKIGHSSDMMFYCDGDGDFNPTFELPDYKPKQGLEYRVHYNGNNKTLYFYDVENKYVDNKDKELLSVKDNVFAQQYLENDAEYQDRITKLSGELYKANSKEEFEKIKEQHLQKLQERL